MGEASVFCAIVAMAGIVLLIDGEEGLEKMKGGGEKVD